MMINEQRTAGNIPNFKFNIANCGMNHDRTNINSYCYYIQLSMALNILDNMMCYLLTTIFVAKFSSDVAIDESGLPSSTISNQKQLKFSCISLCG